MSVTIDNLQRAREGVKALWRVHVRGSDYDIHRSHYGTIESARDFGNKLEWCVLHCLENPDCLRKKVNTE